MTGIFTGVGALIAFLGTSLTALITSRAQREQRRETQAEKLIDARRDAYAAALSAVVTFMNIARELNDQISLKSSEQSPVREAYEAYKADWRTVVQAISKVEIIGPPELATQALKLRRSLDVYRYGLDYRYSEYLSNYQSDQLDRLEESLIDSYGTYRNNRLRYIELAQQYSRAASSST